MPRPPVVLASETVNHVTQHATDSEVFARDSLDRDAAVALLGKTVARFDLELYDYCVLTNHLHLLVKAPRANLPRAMQYFFARLVERFNRRHCREGHLVQAPYRAKPVLNDDHALWVRAYIALNPVWAGICARPEAYLWSGYGGRAGSCRCRTGRRASSSRLRSATAFARRAPAAPIASSGHDRRLERWTWPAQT